jgi:phage terminase large subunit-like protein
MRFEPERAMGDVGYGGDWRTEAGQLLYPELLDEAKVLSVERALGQSATQAQLQQNPRPADSGILKVSKIPAIHRSQLPPLDRIVRAWDLAATEGAGCYTAGVLIGIQRRRSHHGDQHAIGPATDRFFVLDCVREQTDDPLELMRRTAMLDAHQWGRVDLCFEQQPGGAGVILTRQIRDHLRPFDPKPIPPKGSKMQRAEGFASAIQFGELSSLEGHYLKEYLAELERFPAMPCDQVDASSLAYQALEHTKRQLVFALDDSSTLPAPAERCQSRDCQRPMFLPDGYCCGSCREGTGRHTPDCCMSYTNWYNSKR